MVIFKLQKRRQYDIRLIRLSYGSGSSIIGLTGKAERSKLTSMENCRLWARVNSAPLAILAIEGPLA